MPIINNNWTSQSTLKSNGGITFAKIIVCIHIPIYIYIKYICIIHTYIYICVNVGCYINIYITIHNANMLDAHRLKKKTKNIYIYIQTSRERWTHQLMS